MPPYVFLIEVWLAKISSKKNLISIKRYRGKTFGGGGRLDPPLDQEGLIRGSLYNHHEPVEYLSESCRKIFRKLMKYHLKPIF